MPGGTHPSPTCGRVSAWRLFRERLAVPGVLGVPGRARGVLPIPRVGGGQVVQRQVRTKPIFSLAPGCSGGRPHHIER